MRLLQIKERSEFSLVEYVGRDIPRYAILSHTWGADHEEVTFRDLMEGVGKSKTGYRKLSFCGKQAASDGLQFFWVDTCCIDKSSSAELQEAINSMFQWYRKAEKCYVYLSDVSVDALTCKDQSFQKCRWFTRGWTLQELLAPVSVEFFSMECDLLGNKTALAPEIAEITGISIEALRGKDLSEISVDERFRWARYRKTTREEDFAYSLLGIFNIHMPLIYGEGQEKALNRLKKEIKKPLVELSTASSVWVISCLLSTFVAIVVIYYQIFHKTIPSRLDLNRAPQQRPSSVPGISDYAERHKDDVWAHGAAGYAAVPWLVPFVRPASFAGRETQLAQLDAHISSNGGRRLAIYGLGGCGKTALALESAYRTSEQQLDRAVFWVPAASLESFEQAYRKIGTLLRIPGITDDKADVKRLVKAKLSDEGFGLWLMIVDNADDTSVLFDQLERVSSGDRLIDFLPRSRKGSIVFTTRTRVAAIKLAESNVIGIGELDEKEAKKMLETRLLRRDLLQDTTVVREFLKLLTFLPLAIVQAVAFINTNNSTLSEYISVYKEREEDAIELLSKEFEDHSRYRDTKNPVATTWYISFKQIQRQDPLAADYLSFMACTTGENIPGSLLPPGSSKLATMEAVGTLDAYAFVTERRRSQQGGDGRYTERMFDMHQLVWLAMHNWLREHGQWQKWVKKALARLVEVVPFGDYDNREVWTTYLPHAIYVADLAEVYKMEDGMSLLDRIGRCEQTLGRHKTAEVAHRKALKQREKVLGKEHQDTLSNMNNLALALSYQGKCAEAEKIHRETLTLMEKVLGNEHPDTLASMNNLALALSYQRKNAEAEKIHRETLALTEKVLGKEHRDTLASMNNLALALSYLGKNAEAEKMHRETLALKEKVLGKEHPDTLTSMSNLARALSFQGNYAEAEKMHRETLALMEKVSGKEHPNTLTSVYSLAYTMHQCGQDEEAISLYHRACIGYEQALGWSHPTTQVCLNHYSSLQTVVKASQAAQEVIVYGRSYYTIKRLQNYIGYFES